MRRALCTIRPLARSDRLPRGLLGMLLLVVAGETFVARHALDRFANVDYGAWSHQSRVTLPHARPGTIACFGDSVMESGLAPTVLEAEAGRPAVNLAVSGGMPPISYTLFRRLIDSGIRPEAVVLDTFPWLLCDSPLRMPGRFTALASVRDAVEIAATARSASFLASFLAARISPSYRSRFEVRRNLGDALAGKPMTWAYQLPPHFVRNRTVNHGALLWPARPPEPSERDPALWAKRFCPPNFVAYPANEVYLRRFFALAQAHRIPVYWLLTPFRPDLRAHCERSGFVARQTRFTQRLLADFPGVTVVDARRAGFEAGAFVDPHHLASTGAGLLSLEVARVIRSAREGMQVSRWIELPPCRAEPLPIALEDLGRSRDLLAAGRAAMPVRR